MPLASADGAQARCSVAVVPSDPGATRLAVGDAAVGALVSGGPVDPSVVQR